MVTEPSARKMKTAIQYDPRNRGLRLALAYVRIQRDGQDVYDLYGFLAGYSGGGCYEDEYFRVEERCGIFTTYTVSPSGSYWTYDRIGETGLVGEDVERPVESILESVHDFLFRRWIRWTDDGLPDLQNAAKRRLNCWRRRVFWLSPGFNYELLEFMSPKWPVALSFGEDADKFRHRARLRLAQFRVPRPTISSDTDSR